MGMGSGRCAQLAADFVMVGQGPEFDAVDSRPAGQLFQGQGPIGHDGVAVKIGIENGHA
jgi:hypothetical protein